MSQFVKYLELIAFVCAGFNWKNIKHNSFLKGMALVIGLITISEFVGYYLWINHIKNLWYYNGIQIPLVFCSYFFIFYSHISNRSLKKIGMAIIAIFVLGYVISYLSINPDKVFCTIGYVIGCVSIATFAIINISILITDKVQVDFLKMPLFYLMLILMVYYLSTIPYYAISYIFYQQKNMLSLLAVLKLVTTFLNYILYITFCITFLWEKKKR